MKVSLVNLVMTQWLYIAWNQNCSQYSKQWSDISLFLCILPHNNHVPSTPHMSVITHPPSPLTPGPNLPHHSSSDSNFSQITIPTKPDKGTCRLSLHLQFIPVEQNLDFQHECAYFPISLSLCHCVSNRNESITFVDNSCSIAPPSNDTQTISLDIKITRKLVNLWFQ